MLGVFFSILAGSLIALQAVFNTRLSDKVGLIETTALVHFAGLVLSLILSLIFGRGDLTMVREVNPLYLTGGFLGVIIVYSSMEGINHLSPSLSVAIVLVFQLILSTIIDALGLFDTNKMDFSLNRFLGILIMIIGIFVFQYNPNK